MEARDISIDHYLASYPGRRHILYRLATEREDSTGTVYTPREIMQQPLLWKETARRMQALAPELRDFIGTSGLFDDHCRPGIILTGAGTSDYVGLSLVDLFRVRYRAFSANWPTTRITACPDVFFDTQQRMLMIHFARSGDSPESRAVLEMSLDLQPDQIKHIVVTCNGNGALAAVARANPDRVFLIVLNELSNDRGLAMTSSFSSMVVAGQAIAYLDDIESFVERVDRMAQAGEHVIDQYSDTIYQLADPSIDRVFYLGNNDLFGAAVESALKVQELTEGRVLAKGEDTLAFRHGPISAIDENSLICFYLSAGEYTRQYELDVLSQYREAFRALGANVVVFADQMSDVDVWEGLTSISYDPDERWKLPSLHQIDVAVLFGQLFGVFSAYRRGINVDNPSGDKALYSRTVQGVKIYAFTNGQ